MDDELSRIYSPQTNPTAVQEELDIRPDNYIAYKEDRLVRHSNASIDFWMSNNDRHAISYNHYMDVRYQRSEGLVITFTHYVVTIQGSGLEQLYNNLKRHRVASIWEANDHEQIAADDTETVVRKIDIRQHGH